MILNPVAGHCTPAEVRAALDASLGAQGWEYDTYETEPDDDLSEAARRCRSGDYDLVVAAGGDGTVSLVANHLAGSDIPLGILPVGTANVLALELGIPQAVGDAAAVLTGEHRVSALDMMQLGDRHFILQIGIGLDSLMIQDTARSAKRMFGRLAYIGTLVAKLFGYQSRRFTILVDGQRMRVRAWQVLVANAGTLGVPPFRWGPDITPGDGTLDLCLFNVRQLQDYGRLLWQFMTGRYKSGPNISYVRVQRQVTITADSPLPVQADGEIIGETPISVSVVPQGIKVIVPTDHSQSPASIIEIAEEAAIHE